MKSEMEEWEVTGTQINQINEAEIKRLSDDKMYRFVTEVAMAKMLLQSNLISSPEYKKIIKTVEKKFNLSASILKLEKNIRNI